MDALSFNFRLDRVDSRLPKATQVYEVIRAAIISMDFPPGTTLPEKAICSQLDVSRTPFREAVLQLAIEDLVTVKPGEGTFVNKILLQEVLDGQIVRDTVEMRLLRLAARRFKPEFDTTFELLIFQQRSAADRDDFEEFFRLDNEFHRTICGCAGFPKVWRTIQLSTGQLDRVRRLAFPLENNCGTVISEHVQIFDCMRRNDEEGAAAAFQIQLDSTFDTLELIKRVEPDLLSADKPYGLDVIR